jgi:DNA-binding transcriptional regulator YiaG
MTPAFQSSKPGYGHRIKAVRSALSFNQTEFARKLKVTQGTISDWETEKTYPGRGMLRLIADLCFEPDRVFHWLESGRDPLLLRPRA